MSLYTPVLGGLLAAVLALPAVACPAHEALKSAQSPMQMLQNASGMDHAHSAMADGPMMIVDAYARTSRPGAPTGAAFMAITNTTDAPDRLIDARSDIAARVELHTHQDDGNGVMKMIHVEEGFEIGAGETILLERGGKHVMFMGLNGALEDGTTVPVTLVFENAGEVMIDVPVDLTRMPDMQGHGHMTHGNDS